MNGQTSDIDRSRFVGALNAVPVCRRRVADTDWFPAVDVSETSEEYWFEFDLPGMAPDEIQIRLNANTLLLTGVRRTLLHSGKCLRGERPAGSFVRRFDLPPDARGDKLCTTLQDGVLRLRVPRETTRQQNGGSGPARLEEAKDECVHS